VVPSQRQPGSKAACGGNCDVNEGAPLWRPLPTATMGQILERYSVSAMSALRH
jgi:hypothetical protein